MIGALATLLSGCGEQSKYDGVYICDVIQVFNNKTIESNGKYTFPKNTKEAKIKLENAVLTIYGLDSGNYIGHKMTKPSKDDINDDVYDGDFLYKKDGVMEVFSFQRKGANFIVDEDGMLTGQVLNNCKKQ